MEIHVVSSAMAAKNFMSPMSWRQNVRRMTVVGGDHRRRLFINYTRVLCYAVVTTSFVRRQTDTRLAVVYLRTLQPHPVCKAANVKNSSSAFDASDSVSEVLNGLPLHSNFQLTTSDWHLTRAPSGSEIESVTTMMMMMSSIVVIQ